jgi:hypothetical protein
MDRKNINDIERRYKQAVSRAGKALYYSKKFSNIRFGRVEYTNSDLDELIDYYEQMEQYKLCDILNKLKK